MAIDFMDSFSHYGSGNLLQKWTTLVDNLGTRLIVAGAGRCKQNALQLTQTNVGSCQGPVYHPPHASLSEGVMQAGFRMPFGNHSLQGGLQFVFSTFRNNEDDELFRTCTLGIHTNGTLYIARGPNSPQSSFIEVATSIKAIKDNSWHYIAWVFKTNTGGSGVSTVYVDGDMTNPWINYTGPTTSTGNTYTDIQMGMCGNQMQFCDFFYGTAMTDVKGDSRVYARLPNADGSVLQWTPKTGTSHFAMVDENPPDAGATYNSNAPTGTGNIDTYKFPAIGIPSGVVYAVQVLPMLQKNETGFRSAASVIRQGGVSYTGTPQTIADGTYLYYPQVYEQDPTGASWTVDTASNDEFGVAQTG